LRQTASAKLCAAHLFLIEPLAFAHRLLLKDPLSILDLASNRTDAPAESSACC
jgi:hypothetical protein